MATTTLRYVGDNDALKLSASDITGVRTDLGSTTSIDVFAINTSNTADTFSGTAIVIDPPEDENGTPTYNHKYDFATGDTDAPGTFHVYSTITEADGVTITTYGPITLTIEAKI